MGNYIEAKDLQRDLELFKLTAILSDRVAETLYKIAEGLIWRYGFVKKGNYEAASEMACEITMKVITNLNASRHSLRIGETSLFGFLTTIAFNEARYLAGKATRDVDKLYSYAEFLGDKIPGAETSKDYDD